MSSSPLISIVVSNWNRVDDMKLCIESIRKQDYPNLELIVVDNCSTDGSVEYLTKLKMNIPYIIEVMATSDNSAMYTLNYGFTRASGEFILVMDNDAELISESTISQLYNYIKSDYRIGAVSCRVMGDDGNHQTAIRKRNGTHYTYEEVRNMSCIDYFEFHGAASLFRTSIFKEVGMYDPDFFIYCNELDTGLKMIARGYRVLYACDIPALHHASPSARPTGFRTYYAIRNYSKCINRNFTWPTRTFMVLFNGITGLLCSIMANAQEFIYSRNKEAPLIQGGGMIKTLFKCLYIYMVSLWESFYMPERKETILLNQYRSRIYNAERCLFAWTTLIMLWEMKVNATVIVHKIKEKIMEIF